MVVIRSVNLVGMAKKKEAKLAKAKANAAEMELKDMTPGSTPATDPSKEKKE